MVMCPQGKAAVGESQVQSEFASLQEQLSGVEQYAMRYLEAERAHITDMELRQAEVCLSLSLSFSLSLSLSLSLLSRDVVLQLAISIDTHTHTQTFIHTHTHTHTHTHHTLTHRHSHTHTVHITLPPTHKHTNTPTHPHTPQESIQLAKKDWELTHLQTLRAEEERLAEEEAEDVLLTYDRPETANKVILRRRPSTGTWEVLSQRTPELFLAPEGASEPGTRERGVSAERGREGRWKRRRRRRRKSGHTNAVMESPAVGEGTVLDDSTTAESAVGEGTVLDDSTTAESAVAKVENGVVNEQEFPPALTNHNEKEDGDESHDSDVRSCDQQPVATGNNGVDAKSDSELQQTLTSPQGSPEREMQLPHVLPLSLGTPLKSTPPSPLLATPTKTTPTKPTPRRSNRAPRVKLDGESAAISSRTRQRKTSLSVSEFDTPSPSPPPSSSSSSSRHKYPTRHRLQHSFS